jgi:hypothetical protein
MIRAAQKGLSAARSFPSVKRRHRFFLHFGELSFQHGPDEAAGGISLLFQAIELGFEIDWQLNYDSYEIWHTRAPLKI